MHRDPFDVESVVLAGQAKEWAEVRVSCESADELIARSGYAERSGMPETLGASDRSGELTCLPIDGNTPQEGPVHAMLELSERCGACVRIIAAPWLRSDKAMGADDP
jgi:hypothetical protein